MAASFAVWQSKAIPGSFTALKIAFVSRI